MHLFKHPRSNWKKPLLWGIAGLIGSFLVLIISTPLLLSNKQLETDIIQALSTQTGREVSIRGGISFHLFPYTLVRAKNIQIGQGSESILLETVDFHTPLWHLLRSHGLTEDLTIHRPNFVFQSGEDFLNFLTKQSELIHEISIQNAMIQVKNTILENVDFSLYSENNISFLSMKGQMNGTTWALTTQYSATEKGTLNAAVLTDSGQKLKIEGTFIPETKKWVGSIEGVIQKEMIPFIDIKELPANLQASFETDLKSWVLNDISIEQETFSFGGNIQINENFNITGQLFKCPLWLTQPSDVEQVISHLPSGRIKLNPAKGTCANIDISSHGKNSSIEKFDIISGHNTLKLSGQKLGATFDGRIEYKTEGQEVKSDIFLTSDQIDLEDGIFKINGQLFTGHLVYSRPEKKAKGILKTNRLDMNSFVFPVDFSGQIEADTWVGNNFALNHVKATVSKEGSIAQLKNIQGFFGEEVVTGIGALSDKETEFEWRFRGDSFLKEFLKDSSLQMFISDNKGAETTVKQVGEDIQISRKSGNETLSIWGHQSESRFEGRLTIQSDTTQFLTTHLPFLKKKVRAQSLNLTARFVAQKDLLELPDVMLRIGESVFKGAISQINLNQNPQWDIRLEADGMMLESVFEKNAFSPDIWDDTNLMQWHDLIKTPFAFSLSLTNLMGSEIGASLSIDINTKLLPLQIGLRAYQKDGDAHIQISRDTESNYTGFIHLENYRLSSNWWNKESFDFRSGFTTAQSEFKTKGQTPHQLFKNMVADFDLKTRDTVLFGLSPYDAKWFATEELEHGQNAVKNAIIRGLKQGQTPLDSLSCRGILKNGTFTARYGRFSSPDLENGTFEFTSTPLTQKISAQARFGLRGLGHQATDIVWKLDGTLNMPSKEVKINSLTPYDPVYLRKKKN